MLVTLAAAALAVAGCGPRAAGRSGAQLYEVSCAGCHGADLSGGSGVTQGPDIGPGSNSHLVLTDDQIAGVIAVGPGSMPSFGRVLDEEQIQTLVDYIRSVQDG